MGIDTVFHGSVNIFGGDEANFLDVIYHIKKYAKNNTFFWEVSEKNDSVSFAFDSKWRVDADEAGNNLLTVAHILKEHDFTGSAVVAFESSWGDMEAGSLFFEVTNSHARIKIVAISNGGKIRKTKRRIELD